MWNPFKKSGTDDTQKLGMLQKLAMKKMMNMSPQEKEKMIQEALKPENKDKLLQAMEMMKKTGQITDAQVEEARQKLGL
ncbi:MAG: hypothetical protein WC608_00265 [Parcubacteria group bacterium]